MLLLVDPNLGLIFLITNTVSFFFWSYINNTNVLNLSTLIVDVLYLKALSMTNMAASTDTGNPAPSDSHLSTDPATGSSTLQYSMILDHLIGDRRPVKDLNPAVMGGLPMPSKSNEQKMIERGMESCAFKSVLACVGGECLSRFWFQ